MFRDVKGSKKGFTLIELMVVITIIGLLASTVLASMASTQKKARDTARVASVKELQKALELYRNTNGGNYPCPRVSPCAVHRVTVNGTGPFPYPREVTLDTAIGQYYNVPPEKINFVSGVLSSGSILYVTGGDTSNPLLDRYTILLRREQSATGPEGVINAHDYCRVVVGPDSSMPWTAYKYCF